MNSFIHLFIYFFSLLLLLHPKKQISSVKQMLPRGNNQITVGLPVPQNAQPGPDGIYVIVFFNVPGKGFEGNLVRKIFIYVFMYLFMYLCIYLLWK